MFDKVTECSGCGDCQVDVDRPVVSHPHQTRARLGKGKGNGQKGTHLLTSEGNFLSFQSPLLNSPPFIGKSVLSVPLSVQGVPGLILNLKT